MKIFLPSSRRGFAVIMVMIAITVLSIMAGALAIFMKVESQLMQNGNDSEKLLWVGRAGAERACWILALEPQGPTSLKQIWAGGPGDGPETNSPIAGISLTGFPVGDCTVDIAMTEQESKFNVNTADSILLQQILTTMSVDAGELSGIADSIQDWIDADDATRPAGAESDYYQGLVPSYNAKNAPIDNIEELQLIRGITPNLYKELRDVLTPYSNGRVNINTATSNVLACIPQMDANSVEGILTLRESSGDSLTGSGVIRDLNQLRAVIPNPQAMQQILRYGTVAGNTYEAHVTAHAGANQREFIAVIIRNGNQARIVSFYPK